MRFPKTAICCALTLWPGSIALSGESKADATDANARASATVHLSSDGHDEGLTLYYPRQVPASATWPVKFPVLVVNMLKEEVFLEVEGHDYPSYALLSDKNGKPLLMGGGSAGFPDNANLLKRLHACDYKDGKPRPCGCATAYIRPKLDFKDEDLNDFVGHKITIGVTLVGYYRTNGKQFVTTALLPVEIVK